MNGFRNKCFWRQPFSPTLKQCLGCLAWVRNGGRPLPLATIPPGAWHRYMPPCLCAPWHPSHGLICYSLTLAPSTGLAHGRQLSGPGQHLSPQPFSYINSVFSIVHDINKINMVYGTIDWLFTSVYRPFLIGCMLRRTADMLNYFLLRLVGPKMGELKVPIQPYSLYHFHHFDCTQKY